MVFILAILFRIQQSFLKVRDYIFHQCWITLGQYLFKFCFCFSLFSLAAKEKFMCQTFSVTYKWSLFTDSHVSPTVFNSIIFCDALQFLCVFFFFFSESSSLLILSSGMATQLLNYDMSLKLTYYIFSLILNTIINLNSVHCRKYPSFQLFNSFFLFEF